MTPDEIQELATHLRMYGWSDYGNVGFDVALGLAVGEKLTAENRALRARLTEDRSQHCPQCEDYARKIEVARDALESCSQIDGASGREYMFSIYLVEKALAELSPNADAIRSQE